MKIPFIKFISSAFLIIFIFTFPQFVSAQDQLMGELTITGRTVPGSGNFVTVNGERVSSGRTIISPAEISTPAGTSAKITLPNTGTILITPNSNLKLSFVKSGISGDLIVGEIVVETVSGTSLNIQTLDGTATLPEINQSNVVKVTFADGASRINTLVGKAMFNTALIPAGEYFPVQTNTAPTKEKEPKNNSAFLLIALLGAAGAAVLVGLAASSGGNSGSAPMSPLR